MKLELRTYINNLIHNHMSAILGILTSINSASVKKFGSNLHTNDVMEPYTIHPCNRRERERETLLWLMESKPKRTKQTPRNVLEGDSFSSIAPNPLQAYKIRGNQEKQRFESRAQGGERLLYRRSLRNEKAKVFLNVNVN